MFIVVFQEEASRKLTRRCLWAKEVHVAQRLRYKKTTNIFWRLFIHILRHKEMLFLDNILYRQADSKHLLKVFT